MMRHGKSLSLLLLACALLLFAASPAHACSCAGEPTVLDSYEGSDVVVIARIVSVEKVVEKPGDKSEADYQVDGVISTTMVVDKVYKGNLKVGEKMIFGQGGGADCIWTFKEEWVGHQFLFYLNAHTERPGVEAKEPEVWFAVTCGRSNGLGGATDDLLYLDNLKKVRDKTRISGTLHYDYSDVSVEGRKIKIIGANKTYEVKTDKNGVYEIYDLPAGKYFIEPEAPFGWKVDKFWLRYSPSYVEGEIKEESIKKIPIILQEKKHAGLDIRFEIDNAIRGKFYDQSGKPMKDVCIQAVAVENKEDMGTNDCTDEGGNFSLTELPRGSYVLVINGDGRVSSDEPFPKFYYPNVFERERAAIISISEGEFRKGINIYAPKMEETITVEGVLLYEDGKAVVDESVEFKAEKTENNMEGDARESTDARGRFSIKILKGLKGKLYGSMYTYIGQFENCPKLNALIAKTGGSSTEMKTPALDFQAETNLDNVTLKYPFPNCKKAP